MDFYHDVLSEKIISPASSQTKFGAVRAFDHLLQGNSFTHFVTDVTGANMTSAAASDDCTGSSSESDEEDCDDISKGQCIHY